MNEIIFIYNAKSGLTQAAIDWAHKIISPKTYHCKLCSLTYGNLVQNSAWKEFLDSLKFKKIFLYKNQILKSNELSKSEVPCVYLKINNQYKLLITKDELEDFHSVSDLINSISQKLA
jgi:hypothetical protein|tara:strand:+ start:834 stop:1187 length:354 start_codon:yes stop_codon:yes gene_type:complete